jgi:glycosyltransferase involved in cell wall biosynthesis
VKSHPCSSLAVVIPTISGRETWLAQTLAAYEQTLDQPYELVVVENESSWPRACNIGYERTNADIVLFGADDLEPLPGWWQTAKAALCARDELPAARVMRPDGVFDNAADGLNKALVWFTRVPIMRRDQYERIGPWPEITYFADIWVSEKAVRLGIRTRILYDYAFLHHWSHVGRVDSPENLNRAWGDYSRLVSEMS